MDNNFDQYVQLVSDLVVKRESYQRSLGQTASTVVSMYGQDALSKLAEEVLEISGVKISTTTLRNYKWVWEKTSTLDLPDDISYRCLQAIAGSSDPAKYGELVKQGYSSSEVIRQIREEKGITPKTKTYVCSGCGQENQI